MNRFTRPLSRILEPTVATALRNFPQGGDEVDFVIESGRRLLPVEVKAARRARAGDAAGLEAFLADHPKSAPFGILLYGGGAVVRLGERVVAVPLGGLWS